MKPMFAPRPRSVTSLAALAVVTHAGLALALDA